LEDNELESYQYTLGKEFMRAREFIVEDNESRTEEFHGVNMKIRDDGYEVVASALDDWDREMGSVVFNKGDGNELDPQDLLVIDKFRGQGIAKVMYDYVKSKGYEIHKSYDVTKIADQGKESGEYFWQKNRGEERIWEDESNDTAISLSKLGKFHPGADTLAEFVPERATAQYALHPDKWESTFYSLTNKDSEKLKYYGPKKISIPPGTLVGDMAIANKFYRAKTPEEQEQYAELYKQSLKPYPVDVSQYRMPELLIPKQGVAEGEDKSKDLIANAILDFYQHVGKIHKDPIDDYVSTAKEMLGHVSDPTLKSKLLDIFRQAKQNPYIQGGVVTTIGALLAGGVLSSAQKMGLSPSQTNLALQAILNTVIPTVVSRINGKSWSDTIKYTLASAGIGTGIAGMMDEARGLAPAKPYDDLMANMGYFMSLNTVKIQQDAVDSAAQQELANMQQQFRKPILNGMSFFDVNRDVKLSKNPKVAPILLKYVYDMIGYIEPRLKTYIKPEQQGKYLDRLNQIKDDYRNAVQQVS
jgi:hypothetical protein